VTPDERLAAIITALESIGVSCLVMGGHAVRFYGLARNTNDFDLHIAPDPWDDLADRLASTSTFRGSTVSEGPSWRRHAFKRFRIGTLPDGSDEWLEFWRENHLLAPHDELRRRSRTGRYGGRDIAFLGLGDLIRSKETERDRDWEDIRRLEEFRDADLLAARGRGEVEPTVVLGHLRSRAGFGHLVQARAFDDPAAVATALAAATNPITQAFLLPFAPAAELPADAPLPIEPVVADRLRQLVGGSSLHLSLVEVVRRRYVQFRKDVDRRDKESLQAALAASRTPPSPK